MLVSILLLCCRLEAFNSRPEGWNKQHGANMDQTASYLTKGNTGNRRSPSTIVVLIWPVLSTAWFPVQVANTCWHSISHNDCPSWQVASQNIEDATNPQRWLVGTKTWADYLGVSYISGPAPNSSKIKMAFWYWKPYGSRVRPSPHGKWIYSPLIRQGQGTRHQVHSDLDHLHLRVNILMDTFTINSHEKIGSSPRHALKVIEKTSNARSHSWNAHNCCCFNLTLPGLLFNLPVEQDPGTVLNISP